MRAGTREPMGEKNERNMQTRKQKRGQNQENSREISQEILDAACDGDEEAFEMLYEYSYPRVSVTVKAVIRDRETVQDVIQEAYLKAFRELKKLKSPAGFVAWICKIAHNCAVDEARQRQEVPFSELEAACFWLTEPEDDDVNHLPEEMACRREKAEKVHDILNTLPPEQREAAVLYYLEGHSVREIADILCIPGNTVKSRLYYARKRLLQSEEELKKRGITIRSLPPLAFFSTLFCKEKAEAAGKEAIPKTENIPEGKGWDPCPEGKSHIEKTAHLTVKKHAVGGKAAIRFTAALTALSMVVCLTASTSSYGDNRKKTPDYAYVEETESETEQETEKEAEDETETEAIAGSYASVLSECGEREDDSDVIYLFDTDFTSDSIRTLTFLDQMDTAPEDAVDVSYAKDGTVVTWRTPTEDGLYDMYIAASGPVIAPENCGELFANMDNLVAIDFGGNFDTSQTTSMRYMFCNCGLLEELDVSGFDTSNVTDMASMFADCSSLTNIMLEGLDTSSSISLEAMFYNCSSLKSIDVSGFDTSKCESLSLVFAFCSSLTELDLSNFDTSSCTTFWQMFCGCEALRELDLSTFETSHVEDMGEMFTLCYALEHVDVSSFDTSNVTNMEGMFYKCTSLTELNLRNFDTSKVTDMSYMFSRSTELESVEITEFHTESLTNITHMFFETPDALKDAFRSWADAIDPGQLLEAEDVFGSDE